MNIHKAVKILNFDSHSNITVDELKKRYHKLALQYHPDKNGGSEESKQRFQTIQEAFEVVKKHISSEQSYEQTTTGFDGYETSDLNDYRSLFQLFIDKIVKTKNAPEISIIKEIVFTGCKKISLQLFENMDKEIAVNTLSFICTYKDILHIDVNTIQTVKQIIAKKYENDMVFILNPTIDDMLDNNVYKLQVDKQTFFVPLWHSESYFDNAVNHGEIIVKCSPIIPDHIEIDENNVIHVFLAQPFTISYFDHPQILFSIGSHTFRVDELVYKKKHTYFLENQGLLPIDTNDIYNTSRKAGIYVTVVFFDK